MSKLQFKESELISFIEDLVTEEGVKVKKPIVSENKERKIKIWVNKFQKKNNGKSPELVFENFSREIHKLSRNGISTNDLSTYLKKNKTLVNEQFGVFSTLWDSVREGLYRWLISFLGIKNVELQEIIQISLGNVAFSDLPKLMNCNFLAPNLTKGILEYLERKVGRMMTGMDIGSAGEVIVGNAFANLTNNTKFVKDLESSVKDFLCGALSQKKDKVQDTLDKLSDDKKPAKVIGIDKKSENTDDDSLSGLASKYFGEFMKNMAR